jgi:hypothetical protein
LAEILSDEDAAILRGIPPEVGDWFAEAGTAQQQRFREVYAAKMSGGVSVCDAWPEAWAEGKAVSPEAPGAAEGEGPPSAVLVPAKASKRTQSWKAVPREEVPPPLLDFMKGGDVA